ncbi:MAG: restriction endonuclease subunit S [Methanosarcina sp.]
MSVDIPMTSYCLGDVVNLSQGLAINVKTKYLLVNEGLPLLRITDLINSTYSQFINSDEVPLKCVATEDEIIYTRTGQVGLVFRGVSGVVHNNCFKVIPNKDLVDPNYLYWFLSQSHIKEYANNIAAGSVQKDLNHSAFKSIQIDLPSLDIQRKIYPILDSLSNKIEINHQINQTLEAMAQAIFKSWFVDFEPVKAKISAIEAGEDIKGVTRAAMSAISGKTNEELDQLQAEHPEYYTQLKTTAELFPTAMQDSELGEVPEGWEISTIGDEVGVVGGGTPSTKNAEFWEGGEINWTTPKDLSNLSDKILLTTDRKITVSGLKNISSGLLPINTVLMSSRAPVGYLALAKIPVAINQGYIAMICDKRLSPEFVIQWCNSVMDIIKQRSSGTTFAEISKKNFKVIPLIVPSDGIQQSYSELASGFYDIIAETAMECKTLADIRDYLLPKLLSGEITHEDMFR